MKKPQPHPNNSPVVSVFITSMGSFSVILYSFWVFGIGPAGLWQSAMYLLAFTFVTMFADVVRRNGW